MLRHLISLLLVQTLFVNYINAQIKNKNKGFYFKSGAGVAYSFFQTDNPPFQNTNFKDFTIKKTFGRAFDFEIGYQLKKNFSLSLRYSDHKFSNKFHVRDTMMNTNYEYILDGKLYRNQYYWQLLVNKTFSLKNNNVLGLATGVLFVNDGEQFSTEYAGIINLANPSASFHEYRSWEFGAPIAIFYERKLKENILLGLKAQAYILISVGTFESISLNPYIGITF